jgi:hypothetical protein
MRHCDNDWLPQGKAGALCFSVDDLHPVAAEEGVDTSGAAQRGVFARLLALLDRHPLLHATLFVTPDWRPARLVSDRFLGRVPFVTEHVYHVNLHPRGLLRLDKHPEFVARLAGLPRTEVAPHGLHHVHRGPKLAVEFQRQTYDSCIETVRRATQLFAAVGLHPARGFCPPGWNLPAPLLAALEDLGFEFVTAARDIQTPISPGATNTMSGLRNVSILRPELIGRGSLVHVPVNFQATSQCERAYQLIDGGGLLSIKAHAFKHEGGHTMLDGLDDAYFEFLDALLTDLEQRYGDSLWWTSMSELAAAFRPRAAMPARLASVQ